jgi:alpha-N-arabinofuranosidase
MEMYVPHHDAALLPVSLESPRIVVGKDTLKALSVSASRDRAGVTHISLVNIDLATARDVVLNIAGDGPRSVSGRILHSAHVQDHNTFEKPEVVKPAEFKGAKIEGGTVKLTLPACSVVVLSIN